MNFFSKTSNLLKAYNISNFWPLHLIIYRPINLIRYFRIADFNRNTLSLLIYPEDSLFSYYISQTIISMKTVNAYKGITDDIICSSTF